MTREHTVRLRPTAPHLSETRMTVMLGSVRIRRSASARSFWFMMPVSAGDERLVSFRVEGRGRSGERDERGRELTPDGDVAGLLEERLEEVEH